MCINQKIPDQMDAHARIRNEKNMNLCDYKHRVTSTIVRAKNSYR